MAEPNRVLTRQVSPELSMEVMLEQEISKHGSNQAVTNRTQKLIEQKEKELRESITANYQRLKGVEAELAGLTLQLQVNVGPRKHALELLRNKIERQNEKVSRVRTKYDAAKKVLDTLAEELAREEEAKDQLCAELGLLVQQSATAQLAKLEELKNHLELLNAGGVHPPVSSSATTPQQTPLAVQPSIPVLAAAEPCGTHYNQGPGAPSASASGDSTHSGVPNQHGSVARSMGAHPAPALGSHVSANGNIDVQGPRQTGLGSDQAERHGDRDRRLLEEVKAARVKAANGSRSNSPANSTEGVGTVAARRAPAGVTLFAPSQQPQMQIQAAAVGSGHAGKFSGFDV